MNKLEKNDKHILYRFLKDAGLFSLWKEYVHAKNYKYNSHLLPMDKIIGNSCFSRYIRSKLKVEFSYNVVEHFRNYIAIKHPEHFSKLAKAKVHENIKCEFMFKDGKYLIKGIHYDI